MPTLAQFNPGQTNLIQKVAQGQSLMQRAQNMKFERERHEQNKVKFVSEIATMDLQQQQAQIRLQQARNGLKEQEEAASLKHKQLVSDENAIDNKARAAEDELGHAVGGRSGDSGFDAVMAVMNDPNVSAVDKAAAGSKWVGAYGRLSKSTLNPDLAGEFSDFMSQIIDADTTNQRNVLAEQSAAADEMFTVLSGAQTHEDLQRVTGDPRFALARKNPDFQTSYTAQQKYVNDRVADERGEVTGLRKEFNALKGIKDFRTVDSAFNKIVTGERLASDDSPAGDLSLIFNYMKLLDPGSVVRESEFATAQNAAGIPDRIKNMWNRALKGTFLTARQRKDFRDQARNVFEAQVQSVLPELQQFSDLAGTQAGKVLNPLDERFVAAGSEGIQAVISELSSARSVSLTTGLETGDL